MYTYPQALNAMEAIAKDLLRRARPLVTWNVQVVTDARTGTASVDWHGDPDVDRYISVVINMPVRNVTYRMTELEFDRWCAYLLHEIGHPLHTSMRVWKDAVRVGKHRLLNALEDVREEKCTIDLGIAANARHVFSRLIDGLHAQAVAGGYDPNEPQNIGWTMSALGRKANGYDVDVSDIHARLKPSGIVSRVLTWAMRDLAACTSTQECYDLAGRVIAAINAQRVELPEGDMPGGDQPKGGKSLPEELSDEPEGEPKDEEDDEEASGRNGGDVPREPKEKQAEKPFTDEDVKDADLRPKSDEDMVSSNQDTVVQGRLTMILRDSEARVFKDKAISGRNTLGMVEVVTGNASKMGRQRALLARAIKSPDLDDYEGGRRNGRLDRRALASLPTGNANVFGKRIVVEGYDTDVQVLVDASGSMSGKRITAAASLALVVAQAASQVGVSCTAHVFNDMGLHVATKGRMKPKGKSFGYMYNQIMGSTPLTVNLIAVAKEQAKRAPGKRRIIFIVSDGGCDYGVHIAKAAGIYVEQVIGAEIANLHIGGICTGMYRNEVAVDVNAVESVGLRQLTSLLEKGALK